MRKICEEVITFFLLSGAKMKLEEPLLGYPSKAQKMLGVKPTKFYELNKLPDFPKPRLVGKRPMYVLKEIEDWVNKLPNAIKVEKA